MSKYYLRHTNASGISEYKYCNLITILLAVRELYHGESITIVRSDSYIERTLKRASRREL